MRRDARKQPWQTFPFWFLILSGLAMTVAWKLDLLRPQRAPVAQQPEPTDEVLSPDWATDVESDGEPITDKTLTLDEQQSEPEIDPVSPRTFPEGTPPDAGLAIEQHEPATAQTLSNVTVPDSESSRNAFAKSKDRLTAAPRKSDAQPGTPTGSLAAKTSNTPRAKSPFGPAKTEFQATRSHRTNSAAAGTADWQTDAAAGEAEAEPAPPEIVQTAAIDPGTLAPSQERNPARAAVKTTPSSKSPPAAGKEAVDFTEIDRLIAEGEDVEANYQLSNLYWKRPQIRDQLADRLRMVSYRIYFAPQPHYMEPHLVKAGDLLQNIAKDYGVSWEYLAKLNRTDAKKIRPGQKLKVIRGPFSAVVDLSDMEMTLHSHGHFVHAFPIGTGKDNSTPIGTFKVQDKQRNPTYYGPDGVIEADDPQNPLGEYWLDLGDSYGIHGTIDESSIGQAKSHGCVRMKNQDVADVYDLLTIGSEVLIRR